MDHYTMFVTYDAGDKYPMRSEVWPGKAFEGHRQRGYEVKVLRRGTIVIHAVICDQPVPDHWLSWLARSWFENGRLWRTIDLTS